ncbi:neprilysin-2-like [Sitodiplosis mosellana]|uniref:neprilysin-2-like n=1 Tax=Sitodiplosis mosellana TaxID=263140 RepID=UPI00244474D3|nr:neprilysin-2-like [Sitodiplosis mosellana]
MNRGVQNVTNIQQWWFQRSILEILLILMSTLSLIGIIVSLSIVVAEKHEYESQINKGADVCLTPECIHAASLMLDQMDETVEPCDEFYNFACGNFLKETMIPDEKILINTFSKIDDKLQESLHALISDKVNPNDSAPFNMVKNLYKACMNRTLIEHRGLKPLTAITDQLGGWPVVKDEWDTKSEWSWTWAVKEFRKVGYSTDHIFSFSIDVDLKNSATQIIYIDQAALGLDQEYLIKGLDDDIVKAYYEYMVDIAVIYGADRSRANRELKESLEFEMKLANISLPSEARRNFTALYNPYTLKQVQQKYPFIQWVKYINALLPSPLSVDENEVIVINVPSYFNSLGQLLQDTPKRIIANYMMWRVTKFSSLFLTNEIRKRQLVYNTAISGAQEQDARWKECTDITSGNMEITSGGLSIAVGALYVRKYFRHDSKAAALEIVHEIRKEFELLLRKVNWMDDETRKSALNKLKVMSTHIGYPDEIMDNAKIEKYYENLKINENNYLQSVLNMTIFDTDFEFGKLRKPVNKTDWVNFAHTAVVNAFYSVPENSIEFPAGILQEQFFSADRPRYLNFGAIGSVIGHEITHGFDDEGCQFDLNGNLIDWWNEKTKEHYLEKAKCIIEQYGNYTESSTDLKVNGILTQGENIADNGGIKEAYLAYQKWIEKNGPERKLPGLKYTPQQMFWISAAQNWCAVNRPEMMNLQITTDPHAPERFRVLGPFSNRPEFARDFNCPVGSPMNPTKKCEVW